MRLVSRRLWPAAALVSGALLVGCGGSVVDADTPARTRTAAQPASPFCASVAANSEAIRPLNDLGTTQPDDLAATIDAVRMTGAGLVDTAPPELRADVQRTVDAVNLQLDALVANGGDAVAAGRDRGLAEQLSSPELAAASRRVNAYVTQNCRSGASTAR